MEETKVPPSPSTVARIAARKAALERMTSVSPSTLARIAARKAALEEKKLRLEELKIRRASLVPPSTDALSPKSNVDAISTSVDLPVPTTVTASPIASDQLEIDEIILSESADTHKLRHIDDCTPRKNHRAFVETNEFGTVANLYALPKSAKVREAQKFIAQFAGETEMYNGEELTERRNQITSDILAKGTYEHTFEELEFGCRLAWHNSGRCIMREVCFTLELRDQREVKTANECFDQIVESLLCARNKGVMKPLITIFAPKPDGKSAPIRVWNKEILGYAAYRCSDGSTIGDPVNLAFTGLCVKFGWQPPDEKSDFDVLPLLISDETTDLNQPIVYELPTDAILEVAIEHPEHNLFAALNLRCFATPAISNIGVDIGGVYYQTSSFKGWCAITEIVKGILDRKGYDILEAIAIACDISRSKLSLWRDDAQLQLHRAILYSFTKNSISVANHHTLSDASMDCYSDELKKSKTSPASADWVWLLPTAWESTIGLFRQKMTNFTVKPQYRLQVGVWEDEGIALPEITAIDLQRPLSSFLFKKDSSQYHQIFIYFGSETGTSLRFAARLANEFCETCIGPNPLNDLPAVLRDPFKKKTLVLVLTSTGGKGNSPYTANHFLRNMADIPAGSVQNCDFGVFALGNSGYVQNFVAFGYNVQKALKKAGCVPAMDVQIADELWNQENSFLSFRRLLLNEKDGIIYTGTTSSVGTDVNKQKRIMKVQKVKSFVNRTVELRFQDRASTIPSRVRSNFHSEINQDNHDTWSNQANKIARSMDLFSFQFGEKDSEQITRFGPGDHIVLYPSNQKDTTRAVSAMINIGEDTRASEVNDHLTYGFDLVKPISKEGLLMLRKMVSDDRAKDTLDFLMQGLSKKKQLPGVESLVVNLLPPGSVPLEWIQKGAPKMEPRFYSIAAISHEDMSVSICQNVVSFPKPNDYAGVTSRWLRNLRKGDEISVLFSKTDFHLPKDSSAPVIFIGTGSSIATFRSFWLSNAPNPMYLFYGCRNKEELSFGAEIEQLGKTGRMTSFIAFSRGPQNMYISDRITQEAAILLPLLHNPKTHVYVCGVPAMENDVRNALFLLMSAGNCICPRMGVPRAIEWLVLKEHRKSYTTKVYGALEALGSDPLAIIWQDTTMKTVRILSGLNKIRLLRPRVEQTLALLPGGTSKIESESGERIGSMSGKSDDLSNKTPREIESESGESTGSTSGKSDDICNKETGEADGNVVGNLVDNEFEISAGSYKEDSEETRAKNKRYNRKVEEDYGNEATKIEIKQEVRKKKNLAARLVKRLSKKNLHT